MITIKLNAITAIIDSDLKIISESKNLIMFLTDIIEEAKKRTEEPPFLPIELALFYLLNDVQGMEIIPSEELKELILQAESTENDEIVY